MDSRGSRIVIIGGGWGGLFTALDLAGSGAGEVTLISREDHFLFTPMLYEYMSGEVEAWHIAPYYRELLDEQARFIHGEVTNIDLQAREVTIAGRVRRLAYDVLVLAVGSATNYAGVEGAEAYALPFRTIADADALRGRMIEALDRIPPDTAPQDARRLATFTVVGAGASGVEVATKMADLLRDAFARRGLQGEPRVIIVEGQDQIVPGMGDELREFVEQALRDARIEVHTKTFVRQITPEGIVLEHQGARTKVETAAVVWTAGVRVSSLVEQVNVDKDRRGLIKVGPTLQVPGYKEVFALGDIALYPNADSNIAHAAHATVSPRLAGTAQLAYQEAGLAASNVRAFLAGKPLQSKRFAELGEAVSLGTERAAVLAGDRAFGGAFARQARFAMYTSRLPTWHHRLRVSASWFFEGTTPRPLGLHQR